MIMEDIFGNNNTYIITRPCELADTTPHLYSDYKSKKRIAHNSKIHTKVRKAKRRLNKRHNK